ncbi:glycosyltransferase [bacterium]|nr:glycosyltransferase [bacterium]
MEKMKVLIIRSIGKEKNNDSGWFYHRALDNLGYENMMFGHREIVNKNIKLKKVVNVVSRKITTKNLIDLYKAANKKLIKAALNFKPDLILDVSTKTTTPHLIKQVKEKLKKVLFIGHFGDNPLLYDPPFKSIPYYDYFFVKDTYVLTHLKKLGLDNVYYLPQACDPDIHRPIEDISKEERDYYGNDLSFVGTMYPYRVRILEIFRNYNLKIWGSGWRGDIPKDSVAYTKHQHKWVVGREKSLVFTASKININTQNPQNDIFGVSSKVFQIASAGGFQLIDYKQDLENLFNIGEEIITFNSRDELKELADFYLKNPEKRKQIALKSQERARNEHTYRHRFEEILKVCGLEK